MTAACVVYTTLCIRMYYPLLLGIYNKNMSKASATRIISEPLLGTIRTTDFKNTLHTTCGPVEAQIAFVIKCRLLKKPCRMFTLMK